MPELLELIGTMIVFAGLHLLWLARREILFWLETYFHIFRKSLAAPHEPVHPVRVGPASEKRHVLRMLLGISLVFFVGPALIVLGLTL